MFFRDRSRMRPSISLLSLLLASMLFLSSCSDGETKETCSRGKCSSKAGTMLERALKNFHTAQQRMLALAEDPKTRTSARFVVFKVCCGELGNRLLALISSFLVALLTGRGLLIGNYEPTLILHIFRSFDARIATHANLCHENVAKLWEPCA
jgi:hypothetical protein